MSDQSSPSDGVSYPALVPDGPDAALVLSAEVITHRVGELAQEITARYHGREVAIVAVLTGAVVFLVDLMRRLSMPIRLSVVSVLSYPGTATRSQGPVFQGPLDGNLTGKDVLIVDDILDSGLTLAALRDVVVEHRPASVTTCVLLRKDRPDLTGRADADLVGFDIADEFVVGYGMDFDGLYRNLPDIFALPPDDHRGGCVDDGMAAG